MSAAERPQPCGCGSPAVAGLGADVPCVLAVDVDCATQGLLAEWLAAEKLKLVDVRDAGDDERDRAALVIVDVPYPRQGGAERVQRAGADHPGVPVLAISPSFFASICCTGAVARSLGATGVLPKPVTHDALVNAVRGLLQPRG